MPQHAKARSRTWGIAVAVVLLSAISAAGAVWKLWGPAAPAIPPVGMVYQADTVVGFGTGAKFDSGRTQIEFSEITNANRLNLNRPFEFEKHVLMIARVHEAKDQPAGALPGSRTLLGVTAKVVGKRD